MTKTARPLTGQTRSMVHEIHEIPLPRRESEPTIDSRAISSRPYASV
jgi:hypothetical protein